MSCLPSAFSNPTDPIMLKMRFGLRKLVSDPDPPTETCCAPTFTRTGSRLTHMQSPSLQSAAQKPQQENSCRGQIWSAVSQPVAS
jgi:hypothetical protein